MHPTRKTRTNAPLFSDRTNASSPIFFGGCFGELFISKRNNEFDSICKFAAKELDNETNYTYFGARYGACSTECGNRDISIWLSVDLLSDERSWLSTCNYCQWNPIRRVDPDGALDNEHGYTVDSKGNIVKVDNTGGEKYDVLYNKEKYDSGSRDYDKNGKGVKGLKIEKKNLKDKSILGQLEKYTKVVSKDFQGNIEKVSKKRIAIFGAERGNEMLDVFLFLANNSNVEWKLDYANVEGEKKYGLGTFGLNDLSPGIFPKSQIITSIHSHSDTDGTFQSEFDSMFHDRNNSFSRSYNRYVYMNKSTRLFSVKNGKSFYIRHINGDSSRFINMGVK